MVILAQTSGPPAFSDRAAAGQQLAVWLKPHVQPETLVLGLPRGGVPVAHTVAVALSVALDICLVRKLGLPSQPELAMGAIASGNVQYFNESIIQSCRVSDEALRHVLHREQTELLRRETLYRQGRPFTSVQHRQIIVVDDGIATGASMLAALQTLRIQQPQQIIVAVPVAPPSSLECIRALADQVICLVCPDPFDSVGQWYADFDQISDAEVCRRLHPLSSSS
jgi:putative phosphoribosyl transferase